MGWIERARKEGTPVVEGGRAVFVWEGPVPPLVLGDFNGWMGLEMEPVGRNAWALAVELPESAYCEYTLLLEGENVADPLNRRRTPNGFGKHNQYFYMPEKTAAAETRRMNQAAAGQVRRFLVETEDSLGGGKRGVTLYAPAVDEPAALVVVYDGREYLERARLNVICDNLIAQGRMRPLALALVENHPTRRGLEYACSEGTLGFLLEKVLPLAKNELNLRELEEDPGGFGVVGASYGGLMALYTGLRLPGIFGHVLAQSGAYTLQGRRFPVWDLARVADLAKPRVWMDAGTMEHLLRCNREMSEHLGGLGFDLVYREYEGGHNYTVWRDDLPAGLEWLFGLRMRWETGNE